MIGLKQGVVELQDHNEQWKGLAAEAITQLKEIFGDVAEDIEHVGSTSIVHIKAKPVIDIAVAVKDLDEVMPLIPQLEEAGFIHGPENDNSWQKFFFCVGVDADVRTHFIHVVKAGSKRWNDYLFMRDFLNSQPEVAKEYEDLKLKLMKEFKHDRLGYVNGKAAFIERILNQSK